MFWCIRILRFSFLFKFPAEKVQIQLMQKNMLHFEPIYIVTPLRPMNKGLFVKLCLHVTSASTSNVMSGFHET